MKIISEKTGKTYETVDECLTAEAEYDKTVAEEKAKKQALVDARKERATEVENAYKASVEAKNNYYKVLHNFIKDYGSFHMTFKDENPADDFGLDCLFDFWL